MLGKKRKNFSLNNDEKAEIKDDVKVAFGKALENNKLTSIDKTLNSAPEDTLNQQEVDKIINKPNLKTKKASKKALIITIILLVLIVIVGLYVYFTNNPKTIFETAINKTFTSIENNINSSPNTIKGNIQMNINFDNVNYSELNKIKLSLDYENDDNNQISKINFDMTYDNNHLLSGLLYSENGDNYLYSEDILNKYIKLSSQATLSKEEINTLLNTLNKALIKSIDGEKITGSKMQIDIDGKSTKTYRSILNIDQNNINNIADKLNSNLQNDQDFLKILAKASNTSQSEVKSVLNENINELKNSFTNAAMTISIYTKGFRQEFVKLELNETTNDVTSTISITKLNNEKYNYLIKNEEEKMEGTINYSRNNHNQTIMTENTLTTNDETLNFKFNIQNSSESISQVTKETITESIQADEFSEEDINYMLTKLLTNETILNLIVNSSQKVE